MASEFKFGHSRSKLMAVRMTQMTLTRSDPFLKKRSLGHAVHRLAASKLMRELPVTVRKSWITRRPGSALGWRFI